jgi:hypothetical protein
MNHPVLAAVRCAAELRPPLLAYALAPPPATFTKRDNAATAHPNAAALRAALAPAALAPLLRLAHAAAQPHVRAAHVATSGYYEWSHPSVEFHMPREPGGSQRCPTNQDFGNLQRRRTDSPEEY